MAVVKVVLRPKERAALERLAAHERREVGPQAAWIIRRALEDNRLLAPEAPAVPQETANVRTE